VGGDWSNRVFKTTIMKDLRLVIKKGKHNVSVWNRLQLWWWTTIKGYYISDFEIEGYEEDLGKEQHDWNKLCGWMPFPWRIHNHSWRIGWRWYKDELQFCKYCYDEGKRMVIPLKEGKRQAQYYIVGSSAGKAGKIKWMPLFPYHGGTLPAQQDIEFYFKLKKR